MNAAHGHLLINHFPIIATIIGCGVLLIGIIRKGSSVKLTGLFIFFFAALMAVPSYLSGEEAEEVVEHLPGISHDRIEEHEENAEAFLYMMIGLGIMSIAALLAEFRRAAYRLYMAMATLVLALICIGVGAVVYNSGASISHQEIHSDFQPPAEDRLEKEHTQ